MFSNLLALKLEYAMSVYQKFRDCKTAGPFLYALVWFCHARGPHTLIGRGKVLLFTLAPDVSFQRGFLIYVKIQADLQAKKFLFLWSTIYPANFDTFNGHLELVPSGISPFLVFFWPSMGRYRIENFALYEVLATK